ncbi:homoserine kinase [Scopulibacillus daqui]|uniref:Homoserine kinase n=1 Tax=Scopulibacillus daqui TaxID=1469162 RepID=A0ABS2PZ26_9BACL|nr:homoserine kinase [Scopulibacillus daqui]
MNQLPFQIRVPGSTSNLGPGFDSIGLAVNRYLYLNVEAADSWHIAFDQNPVNLPEAEENIIYQAAQMVSEKYNKKLLPLSVTMQSDIPLARGLGSSAAAIVAGVEIANIIHELQLSKQEKAHLASCFEGHPDNATASVYGGLTVSLHTEQKTETVALPAPDIDLIAMIPSAELKTKDSRNVLPESLSYSEAIKGSAVGNVLVAAILQNNWELAGKMMDQDVFHQPYRESLVPDLPTIAALARDFGVLGTALSGAGPTINCFIPKGKGEYIASILKTAFPEYHCEILSPVNHGVWRLAEEEKTF